MVTARDVADLVAERPELEPCIREVLAAEEPFSFDDLSLDSGQFGELVSVGVVEERSDGYHVPDRGTVREGLGEESEARAVSSTPTVPTVDISPNRRVAVALVAALSVVVVFRVVSLPAVFRGGDIVLSGNDPYYYRYWVEQLLLADGVSPGSLPSRVVNGEPLMIVAMWFVSELAGGTREAAGQVLAWYPVISAVGTGFVAYLLAVRVTDDRRVGLAAVLMLAIVPGHAFRTSLGFADHHAFDYLWVVLTAFALVVLVDHDEPSWRTSIPVLGLSVGIAGSVLSWEGGSLLVVPVGLSLTGSALVSLRRGASPFRADWPVLAGVGIGAGGVWLTHSTLGWQTALAATVPLVLFLGGVGVVGVAEGARQLGLSERAAVTGILTGGVVAVTTLVVGFPDYWTQVVTEITERLLRGGNIAEVQSLFGDSFGWLLLFGFVLVLALPYILWACYQGVSERQWLPPVTYALFLFLLASLQIRFVGEFALFAALFAGLGFVHLAAWVNVARLPTPLADTTVRDFELPSTRQLGALVVLFLLVGSIGMLQVPVKTSQVTTPPAQHQTAMWMENHSTERGWEHPENYVLSQWSQNRHYNYFVNGNAESYQYARSNYIAFVSSADTTSWYEQLHERVGYVVTSPGTPTNAGTVGKQLHESYGSRTERLPAASHYRAVHTTVDGRYKVFTLVQGAALRGTAGPNTTVGASTTVSLSATSFEYTSQTQTNSDGTYVLRVPYPGEYRIANTTVQVPAGAVQNGTAVSVD